MGGTHSRADGVRAERQPRTLGGGGAPRLPVPLCALWILRTAAARPQGAHCGFASSFTSADHTPISSPEPPLCAHVLTVSLLSALSALFFSLCSVKLKAFSKFEDTTSALAAATAICDGKLDKSLKSFLKEAILKGKDGADKVTLAVADAKLGGLIKEKMDIKCVYDATILELMRGIRGQLEGLVAGLSSADANSMRLGLAHSLGRYKLKFSPDKVDTMIIQAIALLDELDKELNTYTMRVREWYGWHFPEMGKIVNDGILYAKVSAHAPQRSSLSPLPFFLPPNHPSTYCSLTNIFVCHSIATCM